MNLKEKLNLLTNNAQINEYIDVQMKSMKLYGSNIVDIKKELMECKRKLKQVNEELMEVRALGDLSENADYYFLRDEKTYYEDCIQHIENDLKLFRILTSGEEELLRKKLTEEYQKEEKENYQRVVNTPISDLVKSFAYPSVYVSCGREDMWQFSVNPCELLEAGSLGVADDDDFYTLLLYTPKEQWAQKLTEFVDELIHQTAYLQACYALREAKKLAEMEPGFWNDNLEDWLSQMAKGEFYSSSGILVGKSEHQLDGHTFYFRYVDKKIEIIEYRATYKEGEEYDIFTRVEF